MRLVSPRVAPGPSPSARERRRPRARWLGLAVPAAAVTLTLAAIAFGAQRSGLAVIAWPKAQQLFLLATASAGFTVTEVQIEGRHRADGTAILAALGVVDGVPILGIDPAQARQRLERVPWVRSASVYRHLPDTLFIRMVEQEPLAFWQHDSKLALIDRDGRVIGTDDLGAFHTLPVLVGDDAPREGAALLDLLATEPDLAAHVSAAVRVGARRWNVHFDQGVDVALPEEGAGAAWHRLAQIEKQNQILERDVTMVDLRLPDRVFVKVPPEANPPPPKKTAAHSGRPT